MYNNFLLLVVGVLLTFVSSCKYENNTTYTINSPKSENIYYEDTLILFSIDSSDNSSFVWSSSKDGRIGQGSHFLASLSKGEHNISVESVSGKEYSFFDITVLPKREKFFHLLNEKQYEINQESFGLISLSNSNQNYNISKKCEINALDTSLKMFSVHSDFSNLKLFSLEANRSIKNRDSFDTFYVINTKNQFSEPHIINVFKYYDGKYLNVYLPKDYDESIKFLIDDCINCFEKFIIKRVSSLWGNCSDINYDKKLTVLFSPTINEEGVAIGFFNNLDFFERNENINSESYNPFSNERDIIYIGMPQEGSDVFSPQSICATFAHEYTHAINFSEKIWKKIVNGNDCVISEEIFLDEGCSHLTECLTGYGISGGNQEFIDLFLLHTADYSFCKKNIYGKDDSAGQRGAVCLFLYWLFNRAGGMDYADDGIEIIDKGGISFLKSLTASDSYGWECIGDYFNEGTDYLFMEFVKNLYQNGINGTFDITKKDPYTNELLLDSNEVQCSFIEQHNVLLPKSFVFFTNQNHDILSLENEKAFDNTYYFYNYSSALFSNLE